MDIGITIVVLMFIGCVALTGYTVYQNYKKAQEAKERAYDEKMEKKLQKIRDKKLKKALAKAAEDGDLDSEKSFLGKLGVIPDTSAQSVRFGPCGVNRAEPEGEPNPFKDFPRMNWQQFNRPRSAPLSGRFGRYYEDSHPVTPPWRQEGVFKHKQEDYDKQFAFGNWGVKKEIPRDENGQVVTDWKKGLGIPSYPMAKSNVIRPQSAHCQDVTGRKADLVGKLHDAEDRFDADALWKKLQGDVLSDDQGDENVKINDKKMMVMNAVTMPCIMKREQEEMKAIRGPKLSELMRKNRFDLFRPEIQHLFKRVDQSKERRLGPTKEVGREVFKAQEYNAFGPSNAVNISPRLLQAPVQRQLTWDDG